MSQSADESGKEQPAENVSTDISAASTPAKAADSGSQATARAQDQLNNLAQHPAFKGFLGKSIKLVALFAVLGCLIMLAAINALCALINNALPH